MKSKLEIYALSVCFISVVCLVLSLGIGSYALVSMNYPSLTMHSYQYEQYLTNEAYWKSYGRSCPMNPMTDDCKDIEKPADDVITREREKAFETAQKNEVRSGFQTLIKSLIFIFFSTIALFVHWRIANKSRD